jgi:hypothetical protein
MHHVYMLTLFPFWHRAAMAIMRQQARFIEQLYSTGMVDDQEVIACPRI